MSNDNLLKRIINNPSLGLIPYLVFSILILQVEPLWAIGIGFGLSVLPFIFRMHSESRILYDISAWGFFFSAISLLFLLPLSDSLTLFLFAEVALVLALMIFRLLGKKIMKIVLKKQDEKGRFYLDESFRVAFQAQYALTFHLIVIFAYRLFFILYFPEANHFLILSLFQIILVVLVLIETLRIRLLSKRLQSEEWLPVVSESGDVKGKIAKSVSVTMKNKFLHPLIRVALIHNGMIYLRNREDSRLLDPGRLDYPFETFMQYNHDLEDTIKHTINCEVAADNLPVRFLLKYVFENENTKRLIFLYASVIVSEKEFNNLHLEGGKLWTIGQIEDNLESDIFSECFKLEFEYLKNTVLMIDLPIMK